jgi:hypothetical protein
MNEKQENSHSRCRSIVFYHKKVDEMRTGPQHCLLSKKVKWNCSHHPYRPGAGFIFSSTPMDLGKHLPCNLATESTQVLTLYTSILKVETAGSSKMLVSAYRTT